MISRLTERLTQVKDDACPGTLLFGSDSSAIPIEQLFRTGSLLSSLVRDGSVDFRPCHPLNPYLFEISLSNPDETVITRYGRESRPTRPTRCEPPAGKHYTMPSDPLASSYMYFAEDPGNGITAYALREIPESVCLGLYSGGENTSPRMVKAPHYASTYTWDDGGDVKTGAEPEFSLDARFPGSCAVRLINDCLESSGETTTIALGWDPNLKRLEASKTLHTGRILANQKLTTRYGPLFWCSAVHRPDVIRKARSAYASTKNRKDELCTSEQWDEAIRQAINREATHPPDDVAIYEDMYLPDLPLEDDYDDTPDGHTPLMSEELSGHKEDGNVDEAPPLLFRNKLRATVSSVPPYLGPASPLRKPKQYGRHSRSTVASRYKSRKNRRKYRTKRNTKSGSGGPLPEVHEEDGLVDEMRGRRDYAPTPVSTGVNMEVPFKEMDVSWNIQYSASTQLRVGYWNMNGSPYTNHHIAETLYEVMKERGLSVLCLSDVRLTNAAGKWFAYRFKKYMPGAAVCIFPTIKEDGRGARGSFACMGGSIVIVDPSLAPFLTFLEGRAGIPFSPPCG